MRDPDAADKGMGSLEQDQIVTVGRLKRRADFLRAAKGRRWHGRAFSLQAGPATRDDDQRGDVVSFRVGFTVTKKVGCSVVRNRARRRLREAVRLTSDLPARQGHDYVLVARIEAIRLPFSTLQSDLSRAIRGVHAEARPHDGSKRTGKGPRPLG